MNVWRTFGFTWIILLFPLSCLGVSRSASRAPASLVRLAVPLQDLQGATQGEAMLTETKLLPKFTATHGHSMPALVSVCSGLRNELASSGCVSASPDGSAASRAGAAVFFSFGQ